MTALNDFKTNEFVNTEKLEIVERHIDSNTNGDVTLKNFVKIDGDDGIIGIDGKVLDTAIKIPVPTGQAMFITPGTFSWVCPSGVTSVSVVCVGGGAGGGGGYAGGGGGGGLGWKNNIQVTPGQSYTVVVGAGGTGANNSGNSIWKAKAGTNGGNSYFINTSTVCGFGGTGGVSSTNGGSYTGDGGGDGGSSGTYSNGYHYPGGGAGGYNGKGGSWTSSRVETYVSDSGSGRMGFRSTNHSPSGGGGGVGIMGKGADASAQGQGGSGGGDAPTPSASYAGTGGTGGQFGGGGGAGYYIGGPGSSGAVRIIWGEGRSFPSTNTADL